jgi:hypothetical protein
MCESVRRVAVAFLEFITWQHHQPRLWGATRQPQSNIEPQRSLKLMPSAPGHPVSSSSKGGVQLVRAHEPRCTSTVRIKAFQTSGNSSSSGLPEATVIREEP